MSPELVAAAGSVVAAIIAAIKSHGAKTATDENRDAIQAQLAQIQSQLNQIAQQKTDVKQHVQVVTGGDAAKLAEESPHRRF